MSGRLAGFDQSVHDVLDPGLDRVAVIHNPRYGALSGVRERGHVLLRDRVSEARNGALDLVLSIPEALSRGRRLFVEHETEALGFVAHVRDRLPAVLEQRDQLRAHLLTEEARRDNRPQLIVAEGLHAVGHALELLLGA